MKKRFFVAVLCAVLALALLPAIALAAANDVTIAGKDISGSVPSYYVNGTSGAAGVVYDTEPSDWNAKLELVNGKYKLTLKNLDLYFTDSGIKSAVDLNLHFGAGTEVNNIYPAGYYAALEPGVDVKGDLLVTAEDTTYGLEAKSCYGCGVNVTGNLTLNFTALDDNNPFFWGHAYSADPAIKVGKNLTVTAGNMVGTAIDDLGDDRGAIEVGATW